MEAGPPQCKGCSGVVAPGQYLQIAGYAFHMGCLRCSQCSVR
jgi:hypothetical protein